MRPDTAFRAPTLEEAHGTRARRAPQRLAALLRRDLEAFATLESLDTGIPIRETRMEVTTSAIHLEYFAGLAGSIEGTYQDLGPALQLHAARAVTASSARSCPGTRR